MDFNIPQGSSDKFGEPLSLLVSLVHQCNSDHTGMPVHFDFSDVKFSSPLLSCGISELQKQLMERGVGVQFSIGENIRSYFETIVFYEGINPHDYSISELENKFLSFHSKNYFPITKFPASISKDSSLLREKTLSAINEIIKTQLTLSGNILQAVSQSNTEGMSNRKSSKFNHIKFTTQEALSNYLLAL
jgi:hypothetical protein